MSPCVSITARARADLAEVHLWYAEIRPELGDGFVADVDQTIESIAERPTSFPEVETGVRRALCKRYPYQGYFTGRPDEVRILAIYHVSRDPRRWRDRP